MDAELKPASPAPPQRYYALDALRAFAMLVTPLLHAAGLYMVLPSAPHPSDRHIGFNITFFVIHMFHMEAFFVMSGFFAAMVYVRRGPRAFVISRLRRIGLPLVIFWVAIAWYTTPLHLWFLIYLLIFSAVALALKAIAGDARWPGRMLQQILRLAWPAPILALFTLPPMPFMTWGAVDAVMTLWPQPRLLFYYGVFFAFGWLLHATPQSLVTIARRGWWTLGLGMFLLLVVMSSVVALSGSMILERYVCVVCVWSLVLGLMGVFQRVLDKPNRAVRYVSDASYWIYLVHVPLMIWLYGLASDWEVSGYEKFAFVLGTSMAISLASYQLLVRHTPLGWLVDVPRGRMPATTAPTPTAEAALSGPATDVS